MAPQKVQPGASPGLSKPIPTAVAPETHVDLQSIKNVVKEAIAPLAVEMKSMNLKLDNVQKEILNIQGSIHKLEAEGKETKQRMSETEKQQTAMGKKQDVLESQIIRLQLEQAKATLRFQNIRETPGEITKDVLAEVLAPFVNMPKEVVAGEIEAAFRTSSFFIKKNNLQREIQAKLSSKKFRDIILDCARGKQLKQGDVQIRILKDTPYLLRSKRKRYKKLAVLLLKRKITYVWLVPTGLKFQYSGKDYKITSEEMLKDFLQKHGSELEAQSLSTSEVSSGELEEETGTEGGGEEEDELEKKGAAAPREKRIIRGRKRM